MVNSPWRSSRFALAAQDTPDAQNNSVCRIFCGVAVAVQVGLRHGRVFNGLLQREIEGLRDVGAEKGLDVVDTGEVVYGPDLRNLVDEHSKQEHSKNLPRDVY